MRLLPGAWRPHEDTDARRAEVAGDSDGRGDAQSCDGQADHITRTIMHDSSAHLTKQFRATADPASSAAKRHGRRLRGSMTSLPTQEQLVSSSRPPRRSPGLVTGPRLRVSEQECCLWPSIAKANKARPRKILPLALKLSLQDRMRPRLSTQYVHSPGHRVLVQPDKAASSSHRRGDMLRGTRVRQTTSLSAPFYPSIKRPGHPYAHISLPLPDFAGPGCSRYSKLLCCGYEAADQFRTTPRLIQSPAVSELAFHTIRCNVSINPLMSHGESQSRSVPGPERP